MTKTILVCFDLNKTLIKENSWQNLNLAMGISDEEDLSLLKQYEDGKITYAEGQKILEKWYKERGKATKDKIYSSVLKYSYLPGAKDITDYLKNKGYRLALISGSIDFLVKQVASELKIDLFGANNSLTFDSGGYLSKLTTLGKDSTIKLRQLKNFATQLNIPLESCACAGDGDSDIEIFNETKHGITFVGSKIEKYAWKIIETLSDIRKIL